MSADIIQIDYEQMSQVAARFTTEADRTNKVLQAITHQMDRLKNGGWQSQTANKFYSEMDQDILPAINRLNKALLQSADTTHQIMQIMAEADDTAAGFFNNIATDGAGNNLNNPFTWKEALHFIGLGKLAPYNFNEIKDYLRSTPEGQAFEAQAKQHNITFVLEPDGETFGAEDGTRIPVKFGETNNSDFLGVYNPNDKAVVINDDFWSRPAGKDELAGVVTHEMQHAIDDQAGRVDPLDMSSPESTLAHIDDNIDTEVRAFEQTKIYAPDKVEGSPIIHDDQITSEERRWVMETRGYETYYESEINKRFENQYESGATPHLYEVDYWIDDDGKLQVNSIIVESRSETNN